jgi:drug/metabolite transporter (DMT)-like permease
MGFFFALAGALLSSAKDLISKKLAYRLDGTLSTFASFAYALPYYLFVWIVFWLMGWETWVWSSTFWTLVLLRALTDVFAEGMKMHALAHADVSIVTIFFSLSPILLMLTSPFITGDSLNVWKVIAIHLTVAGSLLVAYRPGQPFWRKPQAETPAPATNDTTPARADDVSQLPHIVRDQRKGIFLALGAAFFFALNSSFDRLAARDFHVPVLSSFSMTAFSAALVLPFIAWGTSSTWTDLREHSLGLWMRGLLETVFMVCKLTAIRYLDAPEVIAIQRTSVVFAIVGGRVLFKEGDFPRRFTAGLFIVAGASVIVLGRWIGD